MKKEVLVSSNNSRGSMKWMSSKLIMPSYKSSESDLHIPAKSAYDNCFDLVKSADHWNINSSNAEIVRVCSDCNTTKTPLWRGGPQGPKSLCNACGIRRRKARKAMALAASARNDTDKANKMQYCSSAESPKHHNVEKKLCTSCHDVTQFHRTNAKSKLSFEDFAMTLISKKSTELLQRDEEEAAILLMALSSGLVHS